LINLGQRDEPYTVLSDLQDKTIRDLKKGSAAESEDAVTFLAKPDLANLAEALVNIKSVKRRASLETECVGGPIDVAVISKDDGFVWINASEGDMSDRDAKRPVARPIKWGTGFRMYGVRPQPTPEEIAARNAAETARKIEQIFDRKNPKPAA
jgi:hypothetical protein